jgi:hypothetical protein
VISFLEVPQHGEPTCWGHQHIQQHYVRRRLLNGPDACGSVLCRGDDVFALEVKAILHDLAELIVIIHD